MTEKKMRLLTAMAGMAGTLALCLYFSAPYWLLPLPAPEATAEQVVAFSRRYHTLILWDTWLQQIGSLLSVIFALALVHLAGSGNRLTGKLVLLASCTIMALSLAEGTFVLGAVQAGENGHPQASLAFVDLASVFIHIFLLAPSLFLVVGLALRHTDLLPRAFASTALGLGILFQVLGALGLFYKTALTAVIFVLLIQNLWTLAASIALLFSRKKMES